MEVVAPNRQSLVKGHMVHVVLAQDGKSIRLNAKSTSGNVSHPQSIDIGPLLAGGLSEAYALDFVMQIAKISINSVD